MQVAKSAQAHGALDCPLHGLGRVSGGAVADEKSRPAPGWNPQESAKNRCREPLHSNGDPLPTPRALITSPVGRAARGAAIGEVLLRLDAVLATGRTEFVALTVLWRRLIGLADDRVVARHQAALVHRGRRVLARRGVMNPFIYSALERTGRHGLHGHVVIECPKDLHGEVLDAVEAGLVRRHGPLPARAFQRDGWRRGSITTAAGARGAVLYRMKSLPSEPVELNVRRGVGLRPVEGITVRCSNGRSGRTKPPALSA
jgi:hypothetical protein